MSDIDILIDGYLDELLDAPQMQELSAWMQAAPANAERVVLAALVHRRLYDKFHGQSALEACRQSGHMPALQALAAVTQVNRAGTPRHGPPALPPRSGTWRGPSGRVTRWLQRPAGIIAAYFLAVAVPLMLGVICYHILPPTYISLFPASVSEVDPGAPAAANLATVALAVDTQWGSGDAQLKVGDSLAAGNHDLIRGSAQINMASGATLIVQAPARFRVLSAGRMAMDLGRVTATVPHEKSTGLAIETPSAVLVDLGTQFGVEVQADRQTHVEVFQGRVRAAAMVPQDRAPVNRVLEVQQAAEIAMGSAVIQAGEPRPLAFTRPAELAAQAKAVADGALARWQAASAALRLDPSLVTYYTFDNQAQGRLLNCAPATAGQFDGVLGMNGDPARQPVWTTGRWPGKGALNFVGAQKTCVLIPQSRSMVPTGGLTLAVWYKPHDPQKTGHIINSMAAKDPRFDLVWLGPDRQAELPAHGLYFDWGGGYASATLPLPRQSQWTFLAVTCDAAGHTVFFVNGQAAGTARVSPPRPQANPILLGVYSLDPNKDFQPLDGALDELAIFSRPLAPAEIAQIYAAGKPAAR